MISTLSQQLRSRARATTLMCCLGAASAHAADSYNTTTHQLSIPSVAICNATFSNMVVTIGGISSGPSGTSATGSGDTFSPAYNLLSVPAVSVGSKNYFNVVASVSGLVSIGGVTGADTFDGRNLTIATVQVGGTVYSGTVVKVGSIVRVGGGMPNGIRDLYNIQSGQLFVPAVQDQVNGHVYTNVTVTVANILSIGSGGNPPACGAGGSSSMLTAAQENAAAAAVQNYFLTLSHASLPGDLAAVAGYMNASGLFSGAAVNPDNDGIGAVLPDGTSFTVFADKAEDFGLLPPSTLMKSAGDAGPVPGSGGMTARGGVSTSSASFGTLSADNPHEIAYLWNGADSKAFVASNGAEFARAWQLAGFTTPEFGVDFLELTLDNIAALGSGHPLDYLAIATHGSINYEGESLGKPPVFVMLSDTNISDATNAAYAQQIKNGQLGAGFDLSYSTNVNAVYGFTMDFLAGLVKFNPGAIVDNQSCNGQNKHTAVAITSTLKQAGAGFYLGWALSVASDDADQTEAFLLDRLLGEQSPSFNGLDTLVAQRNPPQRPFPPAAVLATLNSEIRNPQPFPGYPPYTYAKSASGARFLATTLNALDASATPIEYTLPSISAMSVQEALTGGMLTINGTFPATPGKVRITDASGAYPLTPSSWTTTAVQVPLPAGGNGSSGLVQVFSVEGIPSNPVPLTEWKGQLLVTVSNGLSNMHGFPGSGSGTITTTTNLDFRADVHPVVMTIDTAPEPQNFVFLGVMGDSTTSLTSANVSFKSSDGTRSALFGLVEPVTTQSPVYVPPVSPGTFIVSPYTGAGEPASCNTGLPGPQASGPTNVFCPFGGIYVDNALTCSDNDGSLCQAPTEIYAGYYGYPPYVAGTGDYDGLLVFTMNPKTYGITFTSVPANLILNYLFSDKVAVTVTLAATIQPPLNAPTVTTPAVVTAPAATTAPAQSENTAELVEPLIP